jgi:predicted  nucleic acid-binding Zn-ribbon protein
VNGRILELQELDLAIDRLRARRRDLESGSDVTERREQLAAVEERIGELRLALDSVVREENRLEAEAASMDAKIAAEERRLYDGSVANPKELGSIQAEVANLRERKRRVEDAALDQMERREALEGRLPSLETEVAEGRQRLAEQEVSSERELAEIEGALQSRTAERGALAGEFDEEFLELYEDLRAQKKGVGAAALRDGVCQGCHQKLSALELDRIKRTEGVRRCEYCRRILVLE